MHRRSTGGLRAWLLRPGDRDRAGAHGQSARLRMLGFPWTKYGMLQAEVDRVAMSPRRPHSR